ncbi:MAG: PilZ domain-containing protein [Proteobacteria bacterium]|nr:PilZ domain-containing protein [Pseudomonadota bacterium]MBU1389061.1 PilZ domain-containing protein [Pseudomonadota bacterium]MBU1543614.1 PilZ domain-containing protein [Pseudomonadota bacterium]MBU2481964.1 PilZ domain-containing protein [Pseudomonadota bacterium]
MVQKVFLIGDSKAKFSCPACGKERKMDVSKFSAAQKQVKIKCVCSCKHEFSVVLERRKHVRRKVDLEGLLTFQNDTWPVRIMDISRLGLLISIPEELELATGQKIVVTFKLDDATQSRVEKELIVRSVVGKEIGVQFLSQDHYDKLGPYLLFHFS